MDVLATDGSQQCTIGPRQCHGESARVLGPDMRFASAMTWWESYLGHIIMVSLTTGRGEIRGSIIRLFRAFRTILDDEQIIGGY